jgi:hypothetical protein
MFLLQSLDKVISLRDLSALRSMKVTNYKLTYFAILMVPGRISVCVETPEYTEGLGFHK